MSGGIVLDHTGGDRVRQSTHPPREASGMTHGREKAGGKRMPKAGGKKGPVRSPKECTNRGRQQAAEAIRAKTAKSKGRLGASDAGAGLDKEDAEIWAELKRAFSRRVGFPGCRRTPSVKKIFDSFERDLNALMDSDRKGRPGRSAGRWR